MHGGIGETGTDLTKSARWYETGTENQSFKYELFNIHAFASSLTLKLPLH